MSSQAADPVPPSIEYSLDELRSYLPSGWELLAGEAPAWDGKKRRLTLRILDSFGFDWPVVIDAGEVDRHGRLDALRRAMDSTFRSRLGRPTRGLGLASRS